MSKLESRTDGAGMAEGIAEDCYHRHIKAHPVCQTKCLCCELHHVCWGITTIILAVIFYFVFSAAL